MDRIKKYQTIVQQTLEKLATQNYENIDSQLIINEDKNRFALISFGWNRQIYHHKLDFHIEIKDEKVWIHEDRTGIGVAKILQEKGILSADIVLGFVEPILRKQQALSPA